MADDKESPEEKEENKRQSALRDAMYALNQAQQLQIIEARFTQDQKFQGILSQIHAALDQVGTLEPETPEEEVAPEEEMPEDKGGPLTEEGARGYAKGLGFGGGKRMGMM